MICVLLPSAHAMFIKMDDVLALFVQQVTPLCYNIQLRQVGGGVFKSAFQFHSLVSMTKSWCTIMFKVLIFSRYSIYTLYRNIA